MRSDSLQSMVTAVERNSPGRASRPLGEEVGYLPAFDIDDRHRLHGLDIDANPAARLDQVGARAVILLCSHCRMFHFGMQM